MKALQQSDWVEATVASLNWRQKIAQLLHPPLTFWDSRINQSTLLGQIIHAQTGGAFLSGRPYRELRELVKKVASGVSVPPIFSGDCECGPNAAVEGASFGYAMSLAAIVDLQEAAEIAYSVGRIAAIQSRAVGIRWSFAPVVDLNLHPGNPITNARSYGDDPERVSICAVAYMRGLQDHGVAATLKHFPGDGVDDRDQHVVTAINSLSSKEWSETFGHTFRAGIDAGCAAVMVGHIALVGRSTRDWTSGRLLPATADRRIQGQLLREEMGFNGVIISDAIGMGGMAGHFASENEQVVANLASGSDMVLFPMKVESAIDAILYALDEGRLSENELLTSVRRILKLKEQYSAVDPTMFPDDETAHAAFMADHSALMRRLARRSITLAVDRGKLLPLSLQEHYHILIFELPNETSDLSQLAVIDSSSCESKLVSPLQEELENIGCRVTWVRTFLEYENAIKDASVVVYVSRSRPQAGRNSIRLSYNAVQSIDFSRIFSGYPSIFLSLGNPCSLWELPNIPCLICTYSGSEQAQRTAAQAIYGQLPFPGKLPVKIPEYLPFARQNNLSKDNSVNLM